MLINFSVENFLSFKNKQTISLNAGKGTRHSNHIITNNNAKEYRLLKGAVCFGANASGKTNLIKAIALSRNLVLNGLRGIYIFENSFFKINKNDCNTISSFEYTFLINKEEVKYSFSVDLTKKIIQSEKLVIKKTNKLVFHRLISDNKYKIITNFKFKSKSDETAFNIYSSPFKESDKFIKFSKVFLLNEISERSPTNSNGFILFKETFNSFKKIISIFPSTRITSIPSIIEKENNSKALLNFLKEFGSDITNIRNEKIDFEEIIEQIPKSEVDDFKNSIEETLSETKEIVLRGKKGMYRLTKNDIGTIIAQKISLKHGNSFEFDYEEESDGIRRLFDFSPLLIGEDKELLVLIDEIDQSLHTHLVVKLIDSLFNHKTKIKTQYIITSHDINLINLKLLRQDEIFFIDKIKEANCTIIKSLRDFNIRFDKDIIKEYVKGKFGGIPNL